MQTGFATPFDAHTHTTAAAAVDVDALAENDAADDSDHLDMDKKDNSDLDDTDHAGVAIHL